MRARLLAGALALADAVRLTLGPRSRRVLIDRPGGPLLSDDGVTIARAFSLENADANLGARVVRESAEWAFGHSGDGTTTAILLTADLLERGIRLVAEGADPIAIKRGLDRALEIFRDQLRRLSRPADFTRRLQIARISGHHDLETGDIVAKVLRRVGTRGRVVVETTDRSETTVEMHSGLQWSAGCWSSALIPGRGRRRLVLVDPKILVCEHHLTVQDAPRLVECASKAGRPLVIVALKIDSDAVEKLVELAGAGPTPCVPVHGPDDEPDPHGVLVDLAVCTGARVCSSTDAGAANLLAADLGSARRVIVGTRSTRFIGGGGTRGARRARAADLREAMDALPPGVARDRLERRITGLMGRDAVIHVGGRSLIEIQSRAEAFDDALHATRAAIAEGVVPGGGLALLRAIPAIGREAEAAAGDERAAMLAMMASLEAPARQLALNAGADPDAVVGRLRASSGTLGFDAQSGQFVDLAAAGILDPTRVVRIAVEAAVSVAGMLLLAEGTVTHEPSETSAATALVREAAVSGEPQGSEEAEEQGAREDRAPRSPTPADPLDFKLPAMVLPADSAALFEARLEALDKAFSGPAAS